MDQFKGLKIVVHPDNVEWARAHLRQTFPPAAGDPATPSTLDRIAGVPVEIVETRYLDRERPTGRLIFKSDRFVEYEPSDARWTIFFGLAHWEMKPYFCVINFDKFDYNPFPPMATFQGDR